MNSKEYFEKNYINYFYNVDNYENKFYFTLGGKISNDNIERVNQGVQRFKDICDCIFNNKPIWIRLTLWDTYNSWGDLKKCGFDSKFFKIFDASDNMLEGHEIKGAEVKYLYTDDYSFEKIRPIVEAILKHELLFLPSSNVTAYFIDFNSISLLNLPDDRYTEFISYDNDLPNLLKNTFFKILE